MRSTPKLVFAVFATTVSVGCGNQSPVVDQSSPIEPFVWTANTTLEATREIIIVFPGNVISGDEVIKSVIQVSDDDTKMAIEPSPDEIAFESISLWLQPGTQVTLTKTAHVRFETPNGQAADGKSNTKVVPEP